MSSSPTTGYSDRLPPRVAEQPVANGRGAVSERTRGAGERGDASELGRSVDAAGARRGDEAVERELLVAVVVAALGERREREAPPQPDRVESPAHLGGGADEVARVAVGQR